MVLAAGLAFAGCSPAASDGSGSGEPTETITLAVAPDFQFTDFYVAQAEKTFEDQGLSVELVEYPSAYESLEAVISGQADITSASAVQVASLAGKDAEVKALAQSTHLSSWISLVSRNGVTIEKPSDLEGLKVGATFNGIMDYTARAFFEANGVDIDKVTYEDVKYAQLLPALQSGSSDVAALGEPNTTKAINSGSGFEEVLDSSDYGELYVFLIAGKRVYDDTDLKTKVLNAMDATYQAIEKDPSLPVGLAMKNTGLTDEAEATEIQKKVSYGLNFDEPALDWAEQVAHFFRDAGIITATDDEVWAMYDLDGFKEWQSAQ